MEIISSLTSYTLIFFERVVNKNKAKFQKIAKSIKYIKDVDTKDK